MRSAKLAHYKDETAYGSDCFAKKSETKGFVLYYSGFWWAKTLVCVEGEGLCLVGFGAAAKVASPSLPRRRFLLNCNITPARFRLHGTTSAKHILGLVIGAVCTPRTGNILYIYLRLPTIVHAYAGSVLPDSIRYLT